MTLFGQLGYFFLQTELNTGLTFASIALQSRNLRRPEKVQRNRANARTAFDTIIRFREQVPLTQAQADEIEHGFQRLR